MVRAERAAFSSALEGPAGCAQFSLCVLCPGQSKALAHSSAPKSVFKAATRFCGVEQETCGSRPTSTLCLSGFVRLQRCQQAGVSFLLDLFHQETLSVRGAMQRPEKTNCENTLLWVGTTIFSGGRPLDGNAWGFERLKNIIF